MDNHPIPQDITGFQFKLVGNMTIKQFVYLAVGAFFAWIFFFILDLPTLIKWPLTAISIGLGAGIAFIPIDGRPMDVMLKNFVTALLSPSQFVYEKEGGKLASPVPNNPAKSTLTMNTPIPQSQANQSGFFQPATPTQEPKTTHPHHSFMHDFKESREHKKKAKEDNDMNEIKEENNKLQKEIDEIKKDMESSHAEAKAMPETAPAPPPTIQQPVQAPVFSAPPVIPAMTIDQMDESDEIKEKEKELNVANEQIKEAAQEKDKLREEVEALKKQLEDALKAKDEALSAPPPPPPVPAAPQITPAQDELEKQLIESNREKEALEKELISIKSKAETPKPAFTPTVAKPAEPTKSVRSVPSGMEQSVGIPSVPDAPNLITGIVKDPRGNPLQNILIEVKDQDSNPVRAFKTNGLGKFASATSLSNGKYVISFEDSKETHKFDSVELDLVGAPVMPLEIISVDPREELRRELFN